MAAIAPPNIRAWLVESVSNGDVPLSSRARLAVEYQRLVDERTLLRLAPRTAARELPWHTSARPDQRVTRTQNTETLRNLFADLGRAYQAPDSWALRLDENPSFEVAGAPSMPSAEWPSLEDDPAQFARSLVACTRLILDMDMYIELLALGAGRRVHWSCLRSRTSAGLSLPKARAITYASLAPLFDWEGDPNDLFLEKADAVRAFEAHMAVLGA